jgi:hypothetical protein
MASEIRVNQIQSRTGVSTISFTETGPIISGVTTITGDLDVTGLISYDDVTNIDSVGIITARDGLHVTGGSFGLGTDNPSRKLVVQDSGNTFLSIKAGTSDDVGVIFGDTDNDARGLIRYANNGDSLRIWTAGSEKLRISSNGTTTVGPQYDQVKIEPGNGTYDGEATTLTVDGRTNDGNRVALKVDRYLSGTTATTKFSVKYDGTIFSTSGMQAASVNLQSSSTASWFQTGANYGGADYVWAAKNTQTNTWHSGLKTTGDLYLGGNITATRNISLNGSNGSATFTGKVEVGSAYSGGEIFKLGKSSGTSYTGYYNGSTAHGFIGYADQLVSGGAATNFAIRATNDLVFATNGNNERLRIDSSGRLLLQTTDSTGTQLLKVNGDTSNSTNGGHVSLTQGRTTPGNGATHGVLSFGTETRPEVVKVVGFVDGTWTDGQYHPSGLYISTTDYNRSSPTEKVRITDIGEVNCYSTGAVIQAGTLQGGGTNVYFYEGRRNQNTGGTRTYIVWSNGNVQNTNNSYGSISDQRLKENIVDATSQWDDIKSLQIRKYNFRESTGNETHTQIGLIAQEAESVSPGLVQTTAVSEGEVLQDADGNQIESVKSINYSVLYMKAVKALQEAQTRIETLETQLTDALARITALEG